MINRSLDGKVKKNMFFTKKENSFIYFDEMINKRRFFILLCSIYKSFIQISDKEFYDKKILND